MNVLHLTDRNVSAIVDEVVRHLKRGAVLAIPTDTVYGLACDAMNEGAVKKLFAIKGRSMSSGLPVFVKDIAEAKRAAIFDERVESFLDEVWPGPMSVVLRKRSRIPDIITGGLSTVALRIPDHPFVLKLLEVYPHPITGTSANVSGHDALSTATDVQRDFNGRTKQPDVLVDGGELPPSRPSTIIDLTNPKNPRPLRMGAVSREELDEFIRMWDRKR
jgi:L-threonylcarbamoyladenylate synthase